LEKILDGNPQKYPSARVNADIVVGATEPQDIHFFATKRG